MLTHDRQILHSSAESSWRTPPECFRALDAQFRFAVDLAADRASKKCEFWLGPGSPMGEDSRDLSWSGLFKGEAGFLNPPYSKTQKMPLAPWVKKCWEESQLGITIVAILPFAPQTDWYRKYVYGHTDRNPDGTQPMPGVIGWSGHAAVEEWRLPHRISFLRPDGAPASNAGVNSVVVVWRPNPGFVGPWSPAVRYWSYR